MIAGRRVKAGLIALVLGASLPALGGVIISGTRHIYPEKYREISIQVTNDDLKSPRLVQVWLDHGRAPELSDVPFTLAPPVFRIDAGKGQVIRLAYTREPLPADRESLFWLNVLEVPPKLADASTAAEDERSYLRFAFRIRTKVFFRPAVLSGKPDDAIAQLRWSLRRGPRGALLRVDNPSAYHVTFHEVALAMGAHPGALLLAGETGMVAPGDSLTLAVRQASPIVVPADAQVQFRYINDYGAFSTPQRAALRF